MSLPANLVIAFEADSLSGLSDGTAFTSVVDPFNGANTWTTVAGSPTKQTFRGLPVLHIPATAIVSSNSVLDGSFDTACTIIYIALCDSAGGNQTIISGQDIFAGIALTEQGSTHARSSQWFGKTGSNSARFSPGQVVGYTYDGAGVTQFRNTYIGEKEAFTSSLSESGSIDFGAGTFDGALRVRAAYVFNRCLSSAEVQSVAEYAATKSPRFAGNNSYIFCGDSMTGTTGGTQDWHLLVQGLLDSNSIDYNYIVGNAASGWVLSQMESGIPSNVAPWVSAVSTSQYETPVIRGGTNNIGGGDTDAQTIAALDSLMTALRAQGANRFVLTACLPNASDNSTKAGYRAAFNAYMASIVSNSVKFANLLSDSRLQDPANTTYFADGLHETDAGKAISSQITYDAIVSFTDDPSPNPAILTLGDIEGLFVSGGVRL